MAVSASCPKCRKSLRVPEDAVGRRVRCPGCDTRFVVGGATPPPPPIPIEFEDDDDVPVRRSTKNRRPRIDEEEQEYDSPPKKRPKKPVAAPSQPMILGILSCVFCCAMVIGVALGSMAVAKANAALNDLPSGSRGDAARRTLQVARILGCVGIGLSILMAIIAVTLQVMSRR